MRWPWQKNPEGVKHRLGLLESRVDAVERKNSKLCEEFKKSKRNLSRVIEDLTKSNASAKP
jgi:chaperonin cofactor prefoldin